MPFKNRAQAAACYAEKARNPDSTWNCAEWAEHTDFAKLPKGPKTKKAKPRKQSKIASVLAPIPGTGPANVLSKTPQTVNMQQMGGSRLGLQAPGAQAGYQMAQGGPGYAMYGSGGQMGQNPVPQGQTPSQGQQSGPQTTKAAATVEYVLRGGKEKMARLQGANLQYGRRDDKAIGGGQTAGRLNLVTGQYLKKSAAMPHEGEELRDRPKPVTEAKLRDTEAKPVIRQDAGAPREHRSNLPSVKTVGVGALGVLAGIAAHRGLQHYMAKQSAAPLGTLQGTAANLNGGASAARNPLTSMIHMQQPTHPLLTPGKLAPTVDPTAGAVAPTKGNIGPGPLTNGPPMTGRNWVMNGKGVARGMGSLSEKIGAAGDFVGPNKIIKQAILDLSNPSGTPTDADDVAAAANNWTNHDAAMRAATHYDPEHELVQGMQRQNPRFA